MTLDEQYGDMLCFSSFVYLQLRYMATIGFNCIGITWMKNKWVEFQFQVNYPFMALDSGLCNVKGLTVLTVIHVQMYPTFLEKLLDSLLLFINSLVDFDTVRGNRETFVLYIFSMISNRW